MGEASTDAPSVAPNKGAKGGSGAAQKTPPQAQKPPVRKRRFERAARADHPLTGIKLEVLRTVAESRFLSTPQVAALAGLSPKSSRDHLRDLFDMGLLDVVPVPQAAFGGSPFTLAAKVHVPTRKGIEALDQFGIAPPDAGKAPVSVTRHYSFLAHELAVRDVLVWLTRSARANPGHAVERWACVGELRALDRRVDAAFAYRFSPDENGPAVGGLVEADMGTERGTSGGASDRWAEKLAGYAAVFEQPTRDAVISLTGLTRARLVVTVPTQERADWIARRAAGTPVERYTWVAVRQELEAADVYAPVWLRPDGSRQPFVPGDRK
jgi:DNA-binding CsgD family transcriptional regulator